MMKEIIDYQRSKSLTRENLLTGIVSNVKYLASIHQKNTAELKITKERLVVIDKMNGDLQEKNEILQNKVTKYEEKEAVHAKKQAELSKMIIES